MRKQCFGSSHKPPLQKRLRQ